MDVLTPSYLKDSLLKDAPASKIAYVTLDKSVSYAAWENDVQQKKQSLQRHGIEPGCLVAISHTQKEGMMSWILAASYLSASICPLNHALPDAGKKKALDQLQPHLLIEQETLQTFSSSKRFPEKCLFLFTSGSTKEPKVAVLSMDSLWNGAKDAASALDLRSDDRWVLSLPLYHVSGIGIFFRCLTQWATISMVMEDPLATHISIVPAQLDRIVSTPQLRCVLLGGAPLPSPPSFLPCSVTYGLTEMGSMVCVGPAHPKGFVGHLLPQKELRIAEDGEIFVRGNTLFLGYWIDGCLQRQLDWFATKDLGLFCPKNGLKILGRKDLLFISGGENIQPEEIEQLIQKVPGVLAAIVVPKKDLRFGHIPCCYIETQTPSLQKKTIQQFLARFLPKYKIPKEYIFCPLLPRSGLKIDRQSLICHALGTQDFLMKRFDKRLG